MWDLKENMFTKTSGMIALSCAPAYPLMMGTLYSPDYFYIEISGCHFSGSALEPGVERLSMMAPPFVLPPELKSALEENKIHYEESMFVVTEDIVRMNTLKNFTHLPSFDPEMLT